MAKPKTVARQTVQEQSDADFAERYNADAAEQMAQRPRSRMVEVKRTLRFAKAYQYPEGHALYGQGRIFAPGDEDEIPDDFPEGPWWSDYELPGYETVDKSGKPASLIPEGIDPSSIDGNIAGALNEAENVRARRQAQAALGPRRMGR